MRTFSNLLFAAAVWALTTVSAQADILTLQFDSTTLSARPGETVTVRGTITNIDSAIVDLNSCSITLPGAFTTDDCAAFLSATGAPLFLDIGASATVDLFTFTPDANFFPLGLQPPGSFTILGTPEVSGYDGDAQNVLVSAPFALTVTPEPSTLVLLGAILPVLLWGWHRRQKLGSARG